jgi:hypothetical protein
MSSSPRVLGVDMVILNANVITVDQTDARKEALAISDGKFVAVGATAEVRELVGSGTKVCLGAGCRTLSVRRAGSDTGRPARGTEAHLPDVQFCRTDKCA